MPRQRLDTMFAVIRLDGEVANENTVTVTAVVSTEAVAAAEVARLNAQRRDDSYRYFWQATRHVSVGD